MFTHWIIMLLFISSSASNFKAIELCPHVFYPNIVCLSNFSRIIHIIITLYISYFRKCNKGFHYQDLLVQKDLAESELILEVSARLEAERQLRLAQDSVNHLEGALENETNPSTLRIKILPDVKKLRRKYKINLKILIVYLNFWNLCNLNKLWLFQIISCNFNLVIQLHTKQSHKKS